MTESASTRLSPLESRFVLHWGEMGTKWGINRSVAQIHALLFLSPRPLPAEEIAETLRIARSNVSTSLRELQGWGIVRVAHQLGDRRDHFESVGDVWEMFRVIAEERKRRELDPTLALLRECVAEAGKGKTDPFVHQRLSSMLGFLEAASAAADELRSLPAPLLAKFLQMKGRIRKLLGGG